jgi:hypothetical protein
MSFICFKIVDFPDSPAPVTVLALRPGRGGAVQHTQKKHLDFIALHQFVALELVLDLIIPGLAILVFCAHSTTHINGGGLCPAAL